jgi:hypothetical protein
MAEAKSSVLKVLFKQDAAGLTVASTASLVPWPLVAPKSHAGRPLCMAVVSAALLLERP